jgi:hypothetical protein
MVRLVAAKLADLEVSFGVWRSPFTGAVRTSVSVLLSLSLMDDFTQFDALERCREFARVIGRHLSRGTHSKDPILSVYSNFGEGFERDGNREFSQSVSNAKGSIGETRAQLIFHGRKFKQRKDSPDKPKLVPSKLRRPNGERQTP